MVIVFDGVKGALQKENSVKDVYDALLTMSWSPFRNEKRKGFKDCVCILTMAYERIPKSLEIQRVSCEDKYRICLPGYTGPDSIGNRYEHIETAANVDIGLHGIPITAEINRWMESLTLASHLRKARKSVKTLSQKQQIDEILDAILRK